MRTKSILTATATAIALVAGLGSASAGESFSPASAVKNFDTIEGITATVMTRGEMEVVKGQHFWHLIQGGTVCVKVSSVNAGGPGHSHSHAAGCM